VVIGVDGVSDFNALHSGKHMKRYSSARSMCSRWTATIIWMRFRVFAPYRTDRVRRTRSAANGEGALFFFRYGQADAEKRSRACLAPNLGFIRIAPACDSAIMPGLMAMKGGHQMPYKICATVHPDCRLPTRSSMADITVTCIEGEQHGDALVADGSALRR
jgi:hypothetical protein